MDKNTDEIYDEFYDLVNMYPSEMEDWLETEESKSVGANSGDGESVGIKAERKSFLSKTQKRTIFLMTISNI